MKKLLTFEADAKTVKGAKHGVLTGILYLIPNDKICPMAKAAGCREGCLVTAGMASVYQSIPASRKAKTDWFHSDRDSFMEQVYRDIANAVKRTQGKRFKDYGKKLAIRLNGTSDIDWSRIPVRGYANIFEAFPAVQFYDYTKRRDIVRNSVGIKNWHITYSYSEARKSYAKGARRIADEYGVNLAAVFEKHRIPKTFLGRKVISGDETDLRFTDPAGVVVALYAKGQAKKDDTGFVIRLDDIAVA